MSNNESNRSLPGDWIRALPEADDPLPSGFAFFTMRKILAERLLRAERSARWQAALLGLFSAVLAALGLWLLGVFGVSQSGWAVTLPWMETTVALVAILSLFLLDAALASRFSAEAD